MSNILSMIKIPGYVLIGPSADETHHCAGFNFNSQDERFDGCHMGQILPLLWAQKVLNEKIHTLLAEPTSHGVEDGFVIFDDDLYPQTLGEAFASMMLYAASEKWAKESEQMSDFIDGATKELRDFYYTYVLNCEA